MHGALRENGAIDQLGVKYFQGLYFEQIGSDDYRKVLEAMATHLDQWVGRAVILKETGIKETTLNNALRALKDRNIIFASDRKKGDYRLPTRSFAVWLRARAAVREKVGESEPTLPGLSNSTQRSSIRNQRLPGEQT